MWWWLFIWFFLFIWFLIYLKQIVFLWKLSWFGSDLRSFKSVKARKLWGCFGGEKIWLHQMGHPKEIWNHHFSNKFILIWLRGNWANVLGWLFYNRPLMCWFKWIFHFSWIYVCYLQWHKHIHIPATVNVEIIFVITSKKTRSIFSLYEKASGLLYYWYVVLRSYVSIPTFSISRIYNTMAIEKHCLDFSPNIVYHHSTRLGP